MNTITILGTLLAIYGGLVITNILQGLYFSLNVIGEKFNWTKFWHGILKAILTALSLFTFTLSVHYVAYAFDLAGIATTSASDAITNTTVFALVGSAIIGYAKKCSEGAIRIFKDQDADYDQNAVAPIAINGTQNSDFSDQPETETGI
ncbi:MAG: hypothetical protein LBT91_02725 [Bifidobacteriaceae bacterium]|jgi:hypothetical protein|nr:hypothetical protein [Bifidobacteriaceae bacterium]